MIYKRMDYLDSLEKGTNTMTKILSVFFAALMIPAMLGWDGNKGSVENDAVIIDMNPGSIASIACHDGTLQVYNFGNGAAFVFCEISTPVPTRPTSTPIPTRPRETPVLAGTRTYLPIMER